MFVCECLWQHMMTEFKFHEEPHAETVFGLGVKAFGFPLSIIVVWVMLVEMHPK